MRGQALRAVPPPQPLPLNPTTTDERLAQTKFFTRMFAVSTKVVGANGVPQSDVEDAAQRTVLRIWLGWKTYDASKGTPEQWATGIARDIARRYRRTARRSEAVFDRGADFDRTLGGLASEAALLVREDPAVIEVVAEATPDSQARSDRPAWQGLRDTFGDSLLAQMHLEEARVVYLRLWCDMTNAEAAAMEGISTGEASQRYWSGLHRAERALERDARRCHVVPALLAGMFGVERPPPVAPDMLARMLANVQAALGLDDPPPSEPPSSGVRGVDPSPRSWPPSGPSSQPSGSTVGWFGRQAERVGCGVAGALVALALVAAPRRAPDKHDGSRTDPAAMVAVAPSLGPAAAPASVSARLAEPSSASPLREAPREAPQHRSADSPSGESEVVLMKRAGNAESAENYSWALTWLLRHRVQFPAGQLSTDREAAIRRVCAALETRDPRCP